MPDGKQSSSRDGYVLAFDFGLKHIGVALGQTITRSASELATLRAKHGKPNWQEVAKLISTHTPLYTLVGLPLNMDDSESDMSLRTREFAAELERRYEVKVELVDERLTSREAADIARQNDSQKVSKNSSTHEIAACLIAETWLNSD